MAKSIPDQFFEKLKKGKETQEDHLRFFSWLNTASSIEIEDMLDQYGNYFENLPDEHHPQQVRISKILEKKINQFEAQHQKSEKNNIGTRPSFLKKVAIAASMIVVFAFIYHFSQKNNPAEELKILSHQVKILPGSNKAILVLANQSSIILHAVNEGIIARQNNVLISKSPNSQLVYNDSKFEKSDNRMPVFNTIYIPKGGEYQLILPDGSKVWLNAQSSLKYPIHFEGKERQVELNGEAYFEIAKDKSHPFKIMANGMQVKVLGTHFNIMAYKDEASVKTTLLEGSVQIKKGVNEQIIKPGEQAIVSKDIEVIQVNVEEAIEWKNGNFNFSHEDLASIMRKIARWYNVSITYEGKITNASFVGTIPKSTQIDQVLKYLELTGLVHFKITERRIIVMP